MLHTKINEGMSVCMDGSEEGRATVNRSQKVASDINGKNNLYNDTH
jgi:hypothetical protein